MVLSVAGQCAGTFNHARRYRTPSLSADHAVEEVVLTHFEFGDRGNHVGAVLGHGVGVSLGMVVFVRRAWRLGDQGTDAHVSGFVGELGELLVDHPQLLAQAAQARARLFQTTFDQPGAHPSSLGTCTRRSGRRTARPDMTTGRL